jgi:ClpP class serine protease
VVSNGGDPIVAWRAITLLRERVEQIGVLVPQAAYSAATLLAMGADEIVMHPNGNLGPVDPQILVKRSGEPNHSVSVLRR